MTLRRRESLRYAFEATLRKWYELRPALARSRVRLTVASLADMQQEFLFDVESASNLRSTELY